MNEEQKKVVAELRAKPEYSPAAHASNKLETMVCYGGASIVVLLVLSLLGGLVIEFTSSLFTTTDVTNIKDLVIVPVWATTLLTILWTIAVFWFGNKKIAKTCEMHEVSRDNWFNEELKKLGIDPLTVAPPRAEVKPAPEPATPPATPAA